MIPESNSHYSSGVTTGSVVIKIMQINPMYQLYHHQFIMYSIYIYIYMYNYVCMYIYILYHYLSIYIYIISLSPNISPYFGLTLLRQIGLSDSPHSAKPCILLEKCGRKCTLLRLQFWSSCFCHRVENRTCRRAHLCIFDDACSVFGWCTHEFLWGGSGAGWGWGGGY